MRRASIQPGLKYDGGLGPTGRYVDPALRIVVAEDFGTWDADGSTFFECPQIVCHSQHGLVRWKEDGSQLLKYQRVTGKNLDHWRADGHEDVWAILLQQLEYRLANPWTPRWRKQTVWARVARVPAEGQELIVGPDDIESGAAEVPDNGQTGVAGGVGHEDAKSGWGLLTHGETAAVPACSDPSRPSRLVQSQPDPGTACLRLELLSLLDQVPEHNFGESPVWDT